MPPKAKFTREQIIDKSFDLVRAESVDCLTARRLGAVLGSSARPIFTLFQSMDEVKREVVSRAKSLYRDYVDRGLSSKPAFKGVGTQYIRFAIDEPNLFRLLFMSQNSADISGILPLIDDSYDRICESVKEYGVDDEAAKSLYTHLWVYTHGIATLCATQTCAFGAEQISDMMTEVFKSLLKSVREKNDRN